MLQLNKRDLPNVASVEEMTQLLTQKNPPEPVFEAVAAKGTGVFETLKSVAKLVLADLTKPDLAAGAVDRPRAVPYNRRLPLPARPCSSVAQWQSIRLLTGGL